MLNVFLAVGFFTASF
ncbi:hypothetical protein, partial [Vibrio cyclitrophicus]